MSKLSPDQMTISDSYLSYSDLWSYYRVNHYVDQSDHYSVINDDIIQQITDRTHQSYMIKSISYSLD